MTLESYIMYDLMLTKNIQCVKYYVSNCYKIAVVAAQIEIETRTINSTEMNISNKFIFKDTF